MPHRPFGQTRLLRPGLIASVRGGTCSLARLDVPHVAHNTYLEILDELGVPGLLAFLTIVIASIGSALRAARLYERAGDAKMELLSRSLALGVIALLSADFFISNEYEHLLWLLLALPAALLAVARSETRNTAR